MASVWASLKAQWLPEPEADLTSRLFELVCVLSAVAGLLVVAPLNAVQGFSPLVTGASAAFGAASLILLREAKRSRIHTRTLNLLLIVTLNVCWFSDAGSLGSTGIYFFDAVLLLVVFFRGTERVVYLGLLFTNVAALLCLDYLRPEWATPIATPADRFWDLLAGYLVCCSFSGLLLWLIFDSYLRERARLAAANLDLQRTLAEVRTLRGLLPICSWCRKVRSDEGLWTQIEQYVTSHTDTTFTHGMCPECIAKHERAFMGPTPSSPAAEEAARLRSMTPTKDRTASGGTS